MSATPTAAGSRDRTDAADGGVDHDGSDADHETADADHETADVDPQITDVDDGTHLTDKQRRILAYLRERADERTYFKSRLIADELDMTPKEVGANLRAIRDDADISVEKWGYSSSTTWQVTT